MGTIFPGFFKQVNPICFEMKHFCSCLKCLLFVCFVCFSLAVEDYNKCELIDGGSHI